eukprot:gb/GFBE01011957.1/.p1 GENE.gb/GFBE01011957.1/~~gb/GFBE01011957.1/.p1  ORF type:complete len:299 (+),score=62.87 gb/GFBE01011957.1/:1-897(+)
MMTAARLRPLATWWAGIHVASSSICEDVEASVMSLLQVEPQRVTAKTPDFASRPQAWSSSPLSWQSQEFTGARGPVTALGEVSAYTMLPAYAAPPIGVDLPGMRPTQLQLTGESQVYASGSANTLAGAPADDAREQAQLAVLRELDDAAAQLEADRGRAMREAEADLEMERGLQASRKALLKASLPHSSSLLQMVAKQSQKSAEACGGADQAPCSDFFKTLTFEYSKSVTVGVLIWLAVLAIGFAGLAVAYYVLSAVFELAGVILWGLQCTCLIIVLALITALVMAVRAGGDVIAEYS